MGQLEVPLLNVVKTALEAAIIRRRRQSAAKACVVRRPICKARYM